MVVDSGSFLSSERLAQRKRAEGIAPALFLWYFILGQLFKPLFKQPLTVAVSGCEPRIAIIDRPCQSATLELFYG
jgi:hypothetical protein